MEVLSCDPRYKLTLCLNLVYYGSFESIACFSWPTLNFIHIKTLFSCPLYILYYMNTRNSDEGEKLLIFIGIFEQFLESMNKMRVTFEGKISPFPPRISKRIQCVLFLKPRTSLFKKKKKCWPKIVKSRHGHRSTSWIVQESKTWPWTSNCGCPCVTDSKLSSVFLQKDRSC